MAEAATDTWQPIATLEPGHYAMARGSGVAPVEVFKDRGGGLWNVRTGERVAGCSGWRKR